MIGSPGWSNSPCMPMLLLAAGAVNAEGNPWDDGRFYAGGLCANAVVLGEFTGDIYLSDGYQLQTVPEVGDGWGVGGLFGYRHRRTSFDASYARSAHSGTWGGMIELQRRQADRVRRRDGRVHHPRRDLTIDDFYGANVTITDGIDGRGYEFDALLVIAFQAGRPAAYAKGSRSGTPKPRKSSTFRVARIRPSSHAQAAIKASACVTVRPADASIARFSPLQ